MMRSSDERLHPIGRDTGRTRPVPRVLVEEGVMGTEPLPRVGTFRPKPCRPAERISRGRVRLFVISFAARAGSAGGS
jgi:hypothetical protein